MKYYLLFFIILISAQIVQGQDQSLLTGMGGIDLQMNTPFKSIEERYEVYFHGYPPSPDHGQQLSTRGIRNIEWVHPDTITYRQSAKKTVATQEVILNYKLNTNGKFYFIEKHNRRTGHKISETTTQWENGNIVRMNEGEPSRYYYTYEYDENGILKTKYRRYKKGDRLQLKSSYTFGPHPTDKTVIFERGKIYAGERQTIHRSKRKGMTKVLNSDKKLIETIQFKYNKHGQLVKSEKHDLTKDLKNKTVFKYKYDKKGNWVESKEYFNKLLMQVKTRGIIYD